MKTVIFYFTGTGNNYYIAKKLQECIENVDIYPFHCIKEKPDLINNYERVIYCVPVYYSHVPPYVRETLKDINYAEQKEIITIVGCGGNRGHAIEDMRECINATGQNVVGEYMVIMQGNYILSYSAFPQIIQSIEDYLADRKIKKIIKAIKNHKLTVLKREGIFYKKENEPRLQDAMKSFAKIAQQYEVSEECAGCGTCVAVCPVNNIRMVDKKPQFSDKCQQCMACIQWCPKKCIDYENKVLGKKRYHHADAKVREIAAANQGNL